ncbi:MAG TPA: hypothetical protein VKR60_00755 [Candidatus Sulfotelmatobacter sp.]|nr:hypothetical protein [Candidatus Sulfotelmatobacter sp.]
MVRTSDVDVIRVDVISTAAVADRQPQYTAALSEIAGFEPGITVASPGRGPEVVTAVTV